MDLARDLSPSASAHHMVRMGRLDVAGRCLSMVRMKRFAAAALWLYAFWYLGSMISVLVGVPDLLGPALGIAAGLIVGIDPRRVIWRRPARAGWSAA